MLSIVAGGLSFAVAHFLESHLIMAFALGAAFGTCSTHTNNALHCLGYRSLSIAPDSLIISLATWGGHVIGWIVLVVELHLKAK